MTTGEPPLDVTLLAAVAERVGVGAEALGRAGAAVASAGSAAGPGTGWWGVAADAATARSRRLAASARGLEDDARAVADAVRGAAAELAALSPSPSRSPSPADGAAREAVDARLAAVLERLATGATATPGPPGTGPAAVAAWWAGLDDTTREALRRDRPALVGGLDGLPGRERDRANRAVLDTARRGAQAERSAALGALAGARSFADLAAVGIRLAEVHRRLERLTAVATAAERPGRALLALDVGPTVRAAVAAGDVDTARDVGVFTPGFTASVDDLDGRMAELEAVRSAAGPGTAMVAWYGYDAPQWDGVADPPRSVLGGAAAQVGATRLSGFLTGLDAARPDAPHLTAIGHSYGSLTTADAVRATPAVDDAVYLGSPGLGAGPAGPPGHAWVGEAAGDPVADLGWFGADPNRRPDVTGLSARESRGPDGRVVGTASHGHEDYLRPGTTSARNVAAVVAGRPADVVPDPGSGVGDRLRGLLPG